MLMSGSTAEPNPTSSVVRTSFTGEPWRPGLRTSSVRSAFGTGMPSRIIQTRDTDFMVNRPSAITSPSHIPHHWSRVRSSITANSPELTVLPARDQLNSQIRRSTT